MKTKRKRNFTQKTKPTYSPPLFKHLCHSFNERLSTHKKRWW